MRKQQTALRKAFFDQQTVLRRKLMHALLN